MPWTVRFKIMNKKYLFLLTVFLVFLPMRIASARTGRTETLAPALWLKPAGSSLDAGSKINAVSGKTGKARGFLKVVQTRRETPDLMGALARLGLFYKDNFKGKQLEPVNDWGRLQALVVEKKGNYAWAIRRKAFSREIEGLKQVTYSLSELNPFTEEMENKEGFCDVLFDSGQKCVHVGLGSNLAISVNTFEHAGAGSLLLMMVIEEARDRGDKTVYVYDPAFKARPFYERFGFRFRDENVMELELEARDGVLQNLNSVRVYRNIAVMDLRQGEKFMPLMRQELTGNDVVRPYLGWEQGRKNRLGESMDSLINSLVMDNNPSVRQIMTQIENQGEEWIRLKGLLLLQRFNRRAENQDVKTTEDWGEFSRQRTAGEYDLRQLLSHTLGVAGSYLQMLKKEERNDPNSFFANELRDSFAECFRDGYIILRAMALPEQPGLTLPDVPGRTVPKTSLSSIEISI